MSAKSIVCLTGLLGVLAASSASAQQGRMAGPLPAEQQENIRRLAAAHARIVREVVLTDTGYEATTTAREEDLTRMLRSHVDYMKRRMASGARVRRWDPAFEEMFQHHRDLRVTVEDVEGGLKVVVAGTTPEAVAVARNHAAIVSGFVREGPEAVRRPHPAVLKPPVPEAPVGKDPSPAG